MDNNERQRRINIKLAEEYADNEEVCMWMSFADPDKPKGEQFLGVIVTRCLGPTDAMAKTHRLGINPGGEIQFSRVDPDDIAPEHFDVLLSEEDLRKADYV